MIEPSHGQERVSGPGSSLMIGLIAPAAIILTFLLGFQLGHTDERRIVVTQTVGPASSGSASASPSGVATSRIQLALVDHDLQQAYYNHAAQSGWVVCQETATLYCLPVAYTILDGEWRFHPATEHWGRLEPVRFKRASRIYVMSSLPGHTWITDLAAPVGYQQVLGVTLNGSVEYIDLGVLDTGRYVVISQASNAFTDAGPVTFAIGLDID